MPGAMAILKDNNQEDKSFSFVVSGAAIGAVLASLMLYSLEYHFTNQEILDFAWRIPFALGGILCLVSFVMRRKLPNLQHTTPQSRRTWIKDIMLDYKKVIAYVLIIAISAYMIMINLFFPTILPKFYGFKIKEVYLAITISLVWSMIYAPIFSYLTRKFNKITLLQSIIVATVTMSFIINTLLENNYLITSLCIYQSLIASFMVVVFPLMAESFSAEARFTLMAASYNITYAIIAFVPTLVIDFASGWNSPFYIWLTLIILCFFAVGNMKALYTNRVCISN